MSHSISIFCAINWVLSITKKNPRIAGFYVSLLYLLVSTRTVIGQFSGPYSPVRPAKI